MIRALFFDLDGTLLNSKKEISPTTKDTLRKCTDKGYKLFVATARPPRLGRMLSWDDDTQNLFAGGVYYNGGCIIVDRDKSYIPIADNTAEKIINFVLECDNLNIALQMEEEKHAFRLPLNDKFYKGWGIFADEALTLYQRNSMKIIKIVIFYANLIDSTQLINDNIVATLNKLSEYPLSFAMGNAEQQVKSVAKYIALDNDADGIHEAIINTLNLL